MSPLKNFWTTLEELPAQTAVTADWKRRLGTAYSFAANFLHPTLRESAWYPNPDGFGEPYRVVRHAKDDIVGVPPEGGEVIPLTSEDLTLHAFELDKFYLLVAEALGLKPASAPVDGFRHTYQIGIYSPTAGFSYPVYATVAREPVRLTAVIHHLISQGRNSFLLLGPTRRHFGPSHEQLLAQGRARFLSLEEIIQADDQHQLFSETNAAEMFANLIEPIQQTSKPRCKFFPTPSEARWCDVKITLIDGETVAIRVIAATDRCTYADMGMSNKRNGKPTVQWELLRIFADGFGQLDWKNRQAKDELQKRREILSQNLIEFFRIEGDPIQYEEELKGWRTRFHISNIV